MSLPDARWTPTFLPSWKGTTGSSSACRMSREQEICFTLQGGRKVLDRPPGGAGVSWAPSPAHSRDLT